MMAEVMMKAVEILRDIALFPPLKTVVDLFICGSLSWLTLNSSRNPEDYRIAIHDPPLSIIGLDGNPAQSFISS
jgi:hypothetical protein